LTRFLRPPLLVLAGALILLALWQGLISGLHIPAYLLPTPAAVLAAFIAERRTLLAATGFTMTGAALGLLLSTLLAILLAVAFNRSRTLERASLPLVIAFRSAPVPAVAPLAMLALGRGLSTSILVVTVVTFFPMLVNLSRGLAAAERNASELLHVCGASPWQILWYLRGPAALPFLFTGLRVGGANAILGAMLSEWLTGARGLGNLILDSGEMRETELLWAGVITSVVVALAMFWLTSAGERRVLRWRP
jgi:ABC-type nitrate/sulfonate/bicarbonate transport system permease component